MYNSNAFTWVNLRSITKDMQRLLRGENICTTYTQKYKKNFLQTRKKKTGKPNKK
jgi:hypothetical protein